MVVWKQKDSMEAVKLFDKKKAPVDWEYDGEADTLYIRQLRAVGWSCHAVQARMEKKKKFKDRVESLAANIC
jgi:hypothetical protein